MAASHPSASPPYSSPYPPTPPDSPLSGRGKENSSASPLPPALPLSLFAHAPTSRPPSSRLGRPPSSSAQRDHAPRGRHDHVVGVAEGAPLTARSMLVSPRPSSAREREKVNPTHLGLWLRVVEVLVLPCPSIAEKKEMLHPLIVSSPPPFKLPGTAPCRTLNVLRLMHIDPCHYSQIRQKTTKQSHMTAHIERCLHAAVHRARAW